FQSARRQYAAVVELFGDRMERPPLDIHQGEDQIEDRDAHGIAGDESDLFIFLLYIMRRRPLLGIPAEDANDLAGLRIEHLLRSVGERADDMQRLAVNGIQTVETVNRTARMGHAAVEE